MRRESESLTSNVNENSGSSFRLKLSKWLCWRRGWDVYV